MNHMQSAQEIVEQLGQQLDAMSEEEIMQHPNIVFSMALNSRLTELAPSLVQYAPVVRADLGVSIGSDVAEYLGNSFADLIIQIDSKISNPVAKKMIFNQLSVEMS